jgi:hypothetical protein
MKLIAGRPLRDLIAEADTLEARLALLPCVLAVADAIAYAHDQGIVHRDLKPANVIVGAFAETIVIDWGLAKDIRTGSPDTGETGGLPSTPSDDPTTTAVGAILGTPAYMAPEQARGERVDERVDVYALGALLYHVLSGQPPFSGDCKTILLALVRTRPPTRIRELVPQVSADLAAIVTKAMQWAPQARYTSAAGFASDLRAFLTGQLVAAHNYGPRQLLLRWLRRYRGYVLLAAVASAILLVSTFLSVRRIVTERDRAEQERSQARRERDRVTLSQARSLLATDPTQAIAWLKTYPATGEDWDQVADIAARAAGRGIATRVMPGHDGIVLYAQFCPSNDCIVSSSNDGTLRLWDLKGRAHRLISSRAGARRMFLITNNGQHVYHDTEDGHFARHDITSGSTHIIHRHQPTITALAATPDGSGLLVGASDGSLSRWHLRSRITKQNLARFDSPITAIAISPKNGEIALCDAESRLSLLASASARVHVAGTCATEFGTSQIAYSPDGRFLAVPAPPGHIHLWDRVHHTYQALAGHSKKVALPGNSWVNFGPPAEHRA